MAQELSLTRGLIAQVDAADYERVAAVPWVAKPNLSKTGEQCGWYAYRTVARRTVYLHRYITQAPQHLVVDHINGDGLDNRRCNLRLCTIGQNNAARRTAGASGLRGVEKVGTRWRAYIGHNRRNLHLGSFASSEAAARAYDAAALEAYGEFARLNFPDEAA